MTVRSNVIYHPAAGRDAGAVYGEGKQTLLLLLAMQGTESVEPRRRAEEDAAIDAEDILTQAEEANALDPVG